MKILVAGDWSFENREETILRALRSLGHETCRFSWCEYFLPSQKGLFSRIDSLSCRFQNKYLVGPIVNRINADFIECVRTESPDLVFIIRGTHITANTLRTVREHLPEVKIVGYNNDDPFSPNHHFRLWVHFLEAVPEHDLILAYRHHNIDEFIKHGARRAELLRSWYIPELNYPMDLSPEERERFGCDVAFVGHFEPDGRLELLEDVVRMGYKLRIFGPGSWDSVLSGSCFLRHLIPVRQVLGLDYSKALSGAKIALCFLSKLNRDTYTRRCFEIPATGTFMLSEYTDDLASLFAEDEEAVYFRSKEEFAQKLDIYLNDSNKRSSIARNGNLRVIADGHDVASRLKIMLALL